jgi:uncharacterized repeat protein (TIGR03803 family)
VKSNRVGFAVVLACCLLLSQPAVASYTVLKNFFEPEGHPGRGELLQASDGNFYGATCCGGSRGGGTVYRLTAAGTLTTLHDFGGPDGARPHGKLLQTPDGYLWGVTSGGGASSEGTIFRISPLGTFATVHSFAGGAAGSSPMAGLALGLDGNLYGTTAYGGTYDYGTIFRVTPAGAVTILHSFIGYGGDYPDSILERAPDGSFYGTTAGFRTGCGSVFHITTAGAFQTVREFSSGSPETNGCEVNGVTLGADGNLYGTSWYGGASNYGTVFKLTTAGVLTTLHSFTSGDDGDGPECRLLLASDGNFYGTTAGDSSQLTVFKVTAAGEYSVLDSSIDGTEARAGLIQGGNGLLYGAATSGGAGSNGIVFSVSLAGESATVHTFAGSSDGSFPVGTLAQGALGELYGTTTGKAANGLGGFYRISTSGAFTNLHSFTQAEGNSPLGRLREGLDGNFYGTMSDDDQGSNGRVVRISPEGVVTVLHTFSGTDGKLPRGALAMTSDGTMYGVTSHGGASTWGTIFRINTNGTVTPAFYTFSGGFADGARPVTGLTPGPDGNLYGMTSSGGSGAGKIFRITPGGVLTALHDFDPSYGDPGGELLLGSDGNFYGSAKGGYRSFDFVYVGGFVFRINPATAAFTELHAVDDWPIEGYDPQGALVQDGHYLYGVMSGGGPKRWGTIFRIRTNGDGFAVVHAFNGGSEGGSPRDGMVKVGNAFYGTTFAGTIFKFTPGSDGGGSLGCGTLLLLAGLSAVRRRAAAVAVRRQGVRPGSARRDCGDAAVTCARNPPG